MTTIRNIIQIILLEKRKENKKTNSTWANQSRPKKKRSLNSKNSFLFVLKKNKSKVINKNSNSNKKYNETINFTFIKRKSKPYSEAEQHSLQAKIQQKFLVARLGIAHSVI